jgi:hypothetical protein
MIHAHIFSREQKHHPALALGQRRYKRP